MCLSPMSSGDIDVSDLLDIAPSGHLTRRGDTLTFAHVPSESCDRLGKITHLPRMYGGSGSGWILECTVVTIKMMAKLGSVATGIDV